MVDPVVLVWTCLALAGLILSLVGIFEAEADMRALVGTPGANGPRRIVARGHLRRELLRFAVQVIFFGLGLAVMFNAHQFIRAGGLRVGLVAAAGLIVAQSLFDLLDARRLMEILD